MFDLEKFDIKLNTDVIGRNFYYADEVSSTNVELISNSKFYKQHGSVLLAENQTAGKGRKNREWYSNPGMNLTFSVLLTDLKKFKKNFNIINYAASLAVAMSIENLYQLRTKLKWPNDVLIDGKKISGLLTESVSRGNNISRLVTGIGLNVNQTSFQGKYLLEPTSLKKILGHAVEREKTLADLLNVFEKYLEIATSSTNKILDEWKSKCSMIGERISVDCDKETKHGIFSDINENGFLVLRTENKIEVLSYGDVSII